MNSENFDSDDICRVCRSEGTLENPLFHPCVCMGTIKFVHQDCLVEWLKYSKKETCELCKHSFTFVPIYSPDMPKSIPISVIISGVGKSFFNILKNWIHYTLVVFAWLILVPFAASRMFTAIFHFNPGALLPTSFGYMDGKQLLLSYSQGFLIVVCCVSFFMYLVWLKEQILNTEECVEWLNGLQNTTSGTLVATPEIPIPLTTNTDITLISNNQNQGDNLPRNINTSEGLLGNDNSDRATTSGSYQMTSILPHNNSQPEDPIINAPGLILPGERDLNQNLPQNEVGVNPPIIGEEPEPHVEEQVAPAPLLPGLDLFNLNNIDWDRAVEDLTWENLLGLDGSYNFLEHSLWMIVFNALFIFLFAFLPYHYGKICFKILKCDTLVSDSHFDSFLSTFVGYLLIGQIFLFVRRLMKPTLFTKIRILLGVSFYIIKVCLLMITEIGIFPFICGWFLDICSLNLFGATFNDRRDSFLTAPIASSLAHWLVGMVYVFYFASAVIILREVLRPGILWFLRNLNDPDFNPVKEMLLFPALKHFRRFLCSMILFSTIITITVYIPTQIVWHLFPKFLPYNFMSTYDSYFAELPLELLLFHVVVPSVMEQNQARAFIKTFIYLWAHYVGRALGLRSYLLGDEVLPEPDGHQTPGAHAPDCPLNPTFVNNHTQTTTTENENETTDLMGSAIPTVKVQGTNHGTSSLFTDLAASSTSKIAATAAPALSSDKTPDEPASPSFLETLHLVERVTPSDSLSSSEDLPPSSEELTLASSSTSSANGDVFPTTVNEPAIPPNPQQPDPHPLVAPTRPSIGFGVRRRRNRFAPTPSGSIPSGSGPSIDPTLYTRPDRFYARLCCLAVVSTLTSVGVAVTLFTLPVYLGRSFLKHFTFDLTLLATSADYYYAPPGGPVNATTTTPHPPTQTPSYHHDLYTALTGTYFIWFAFRSLHHLRFNWAHPAPAAAQVQAQEPAPTQQQVEQIPAQNNGSWSENLRGGAGLVWNSFLACLSSTLKCLVAFLLLSGLIPLLMGILFEQAVVFPLRIPMDRTPLIFLAQDWMFGLLLVKLAVALTLMGPDWWLRTALEQIYQDGIANLRLTYIIEHLVWPCVSVLGLCLSLPYVLTTSVLSCFGVNAMLVRKVQRHIYPSLLTASLILAFLVYQTKQLRRFYQHIKDERYLVGKKLINYERKNISNQESTTVNATPT